MDGFKLDKRQVDGFADRLFWEMPEAARAATATALNRTAHAAMLLAKRNVRRQFTLRNKWTLGSIKNTTTPLTRSIDKQFAIVGSKAKYLAKQEKGGRLSRTSEGRRMTTSQGSREGDTARPRKKLARGKRAARNIKLQRQKKVRGSKGRVAFRRVMAARKAGRKFLFLRLKNDRSGIFEIQKREIVMVHRIIDQPLAVKATPWLAPAVKSTKKTAPKVFKQELEKRFRP